MSYEWWYIPAGLAGGGVGQLVRAALGSDGVEGIGALLIGYTLIGIAVILALGHFL